MSSALYKNAHAAIVTYDITVIESFESLESWVNELKESSDQNIPLLVLGNKKDLEDQRIVSTQKGEDFSEKIDAFFMEVSAKDNIGNELNKAIAILLRKLIDDAKKQINEGET